MYAFWLVVCFILLSKNICSMKLALDVVVSIPLIGHARQHRVMVNLQEDLYRMLLHFPRASELLLNGHGLQRSEGVLHRRYLSPLARPLALVPEGAWWRVQLYMNMITDTQPATHKGCAFSVTSETRYPKLEIFGYPVTRKQFYYNNIYSQINTPKCIK